jgi:hypothetical protein
LSTFRPWGHIDWLLGRLGNREWSLVCCCGTEERSTTLASHLGRERLRDATIVEIHDPEPLDRIVMEQKLQERAQRFAASGFNRAEFRRADLLADIEEIRAPVTEFANRGATNLLIDITSLPKMWFFPMVQAALEDSRFENVVVTYTSASGYADQLSENAAPLKVLPGFFAEDGRSQHHSIVVGIGFEPLGIGSLLSGQVSEKIRLIFPFPPGPPGHRRNWMFVKQIEQLTQAQKIDPPDRVHIHMYDCPQVFDALCHMTGDGTRTAAIAPYGPKTVSLAMCLFSLAAAKSGRPRVPVYYAQPLRYAVDYTTGVRMRGTTPDITGYCLRLGGRDLYTLGSGS